MLPPTEDLPFLARPFSQDELEMGRQMAQEWGTELHETAPIQVIGSGANLNAAVSNSLERAAELLDMSVEEVRNRCAITGDIEIGRAPGLVTATLLVPIKHLEKLGILPGERAI